MKGLFISFEGNDGSGKSTALKSVIDRLKKDGYDVLYSREPGGSEIAEKIRNIILDKENLAMDDKTEALLYAASRREHLTKTLLPAINSGKIVLCDRYIDSSLAYQGYARGLGIEDVFNMNQFATEGVLPDLTILVCVHPEVGFKRINQTARDLDRLELQKASFHENVYQGYLNVAKLFPERIKIINGELSKEEVYQEVISIILPFIKENYR